MNVQENSETTPAQKLETMPSPDKILCIYHGNCADGFGAAWAMRRNMPHADIEFHAATYGKTLVPDVRERIVYILDFSYDRPIIANMIAKAKTFMLIDHHKSAALNLRGLDDADNNKLRESEARMKDFWVSDYGRIMFDMNRSGAGLAWDFFSNGAKPPPLIQYIQDRDLWKFQLPRSREVSAALFSYPYDFEVWDHLMSIDPMRLADEGEAILRKHLKDIRELLDSGTLYTTLGGVVVPVANLPYTMSSEAGHELLKRNPGAPFVACFQDQAHGRVFSLRSEDHRADVSLIAKGYGGGGHRNAAGFTMPIGWGGDPDVEGTS